MHPDPGRSPRKGREILAVHPQEINQKRPGSALTLLVARVRVADDPHDAVAANDLAVSADLLH
jgi:hypothetical protein